MPMISLKDSTTSGPSAGSPGLVCRLNQGERVTRLASHYCTSAALADPRSLPLSFAAITDPGRMRSHNEDCYCADPASGLFAVVDGVGGHAGGRMASAAVADALEASIRDRYGNDDTWPFGMDVRLSSAANRLRTAILVANQRLRQCVRIDAQLAGMAATVSAVLIDGPDVVAANVGDCRVYLHRAGRLQQVTRDHSWVAEQIRAGLLDREAAKSHPMRNVVTRVVSGKAHLDIDFVEFRVDAGDALLLCSDGLHGYVSDYEIQECLAGTADPDACCHRLVDLANSRGGPDNVTAVIVSFP